MSFKKLVPEVVEALALVGIVEIPALCKPMFSAMKSGGHLFALAPKGSGKTDTAIVAAFNRVNRQHEGAPRVLFICCSIDEAIRVHERMSIVAKHLDVTVDLAHDKGNQVLQRNNIFDGTEIIVGTIKRIFDLYVQNGINVQLLDYLIFDDFELLLTQGKIMEIHRLTEGVNKTQVVCLANQNKVRIEQFFERSPLKFKLLES